MKVFTTPSGKTSINLERVVAMLDRGDYIIVLFDVPAIEGGGMCEQRYWYADAKALLAAYNNQKETN